MQPDSSDKSLPGNLSQCAVEKLEELKNIILDISLCDQASLDEVAKLKAELNVYQTAFQSVGSQLETSKLKIDSLENQFKLYEGFRIVTILNGDSSIFSPNLISRGRVGGQEAAQILSSGVLEYVYNKYGTNLYQHSVYIFLNKRGLKEALGRAGYDTAKKELGNFLRAINQASERFLVVDVGAVKEAADVKVKTLIEDTIRLPQTFKIVFSGFHDAGYLTNFSSFITADFKDKLIIMKNYNDIPVEISAINLPLLAIPNLFFPRKLSVYPSAPPGLGLPASHSSPEVALDFCPGSASPGQNLFIPTSYSSAVRTGRRIPTPELDSNSSTSSEDHLPDVHPRPIGQRRFLTPGKPLSKHSPPPCTMFYLAQCKFGLECRFGHDYVLTADDYETLRQNAKKKPCPHVNKNELCLWGDMCCYGHNCPNTTKCMFLKVGKCFFQGADMHKEPQVRQTDISDVPKRWAN